MYKTYIPGYGKEVHTCSRAIHRETGLPVSLSMRIAKKLCCHKLTNLSKVRKYLTLCCTSPIVCEKIRVRVNGPKGEYEYPKYSPPIINSLMFDRNTYTCHIYLLES